MSAIASLAGYSGSGFGQNLFSKIDTNKSGTVSKEEFVVGRPDDVSAEDAASLFSKIDETGSGELTQDTMNSLFSQNNALSSTTFQALTDAIEAESSSSQNGSLSDMIAAMDTDNSGTITQEEFVSARPSDVTEEMAENLWNSFDTEESGSLSTETLTTAMASSQGAPPPPPSGGGSSEEDTTTSTLDTNGDGIVSLAERLAGSVTDSEESTESAATTQTTEETISTIVQTFLDTIRSYDKTAGYNNNEEALMSKLMASI